MLRLILFLATATLLLTTSAVPSTQVFPRATADRKPDDRTGPQVHLVYAVPSDGADTGLDTDGTLVDSIAVWEQWFLDQTGDRVLRLDTNGGNADITFLRLPYTAQQISMAAPNELVMFRTALIGAGLNDPNKLYGVYYEGASGVLPNCGRGGTVQGTSLGVVYLQRTAMVDCAPLPFRHPGESAAYREFIMVHELLHGLGMVPTCAPHWTNDNHVSETNDVMTGGLIGNSQLLDVGRDDYFRAHIPGCKDLADSVYLAAPPPGAAGNVTAVPGSDQATVSFTPASGTVTSYTVATTDNAVSVTGASSPITVTGLLHGVSYSFVVTATNGSELGPASATSNTVTPFWSPTAPTGVVAAAGDNLATVSFNPPNLSGDSPISHYTVTASPGGNSAVGTASPVTVTGLTNGAHYTFTVKASNATSTGPASAPSNTVTPRGPDRIEVAPPAPTPRPAIPDVAAPAGPRVPPPH